MNNKKEFRGHIAAFVTILIWGTTYISSKVLLVNFTPVEILLMRFVLGYLVLLIIYPKRLRLQDKRHELLFAAAGLCGITLYYIIEIVALTFIMASYVGIIVSVAPFFAGIFAHFCLQGEKLRFNFIIGFVLAIIGISLISFDGSKQESISFIGIGLAILAPMVWAIYSILAKKISEYGYHMIQATRRTFFYGLLFMLPELVIYRVHINWKNLLQPVNLLNVLYLGIGASALCFVSWNLAVKIIGAVNTCIYIYMVPVITIITSYFVLGERITPVAVVGTVLTMVGLIVSERKFSVDNIQRWIYNTNKKLDI